MDRIEFLKIGENEKVYHDLLVRIEVVIMGETSGYEAQKKM